MAKLAGLPLLAAALLCSGCGGAMGPLTTTSSRLSATGTMTSRSATVAASAPRPTGRHRFVALGNLVCRAVRAGAPDRLSPRATAAYVRAHALAALPAARRTVVSLQRVGTQTGETSAAHQVLLDYRILIALYVDATAAAPSGRVNSSPATSIATAERRASVDAVAAGLGACAPLRAG